MVELELGLALDPHAIDFLAQDIVQQTVIW